MTELTSALDRLRQHPGVELLILLGRDGLVIQHLGNEGSEEPIAARVPTLASAANALGAAAGAGEFTTAVIEFEERVAVVTSLSGELLLALTVRPGVGFAPLLRELRRERGRLIQLL